MESYVTKAAFCEARKHMINFKHMSSPITTQQTTSANFWSQWHWHVLKIRQMLKCFVELESNWLELIFVLNLGNAGRLIGIIYLS